MAIASEAIKSKGKDIKIRKTKTSSPTNFTDIENLKKYAESKGLEVKEKKPSIFVRAMDIISRPLYASAGAAKAIVKGNENVLGEAWKGLKGEEKETYSDVLKEAGIDNKIARGVVGFALDVVLDPTTYFGGTLVKGTLRGSKAVGRGGFQIIKKVSPKLAERIEVAGQGIKDALGEGFNKAYGLKKTEEGFTLADDVNRYWNKLGIATDETIEKYNEAFKTLPKEQHKEFAQTLLKFRKQLPKIEKGIKKVGGAKGFERKLAKEQLNKLTPEEARKYNTAEEFVKGNDLGTAGMKFHITDNPNFKIDPNIIPSDLPAGKATGRVLNELELEKQLQNDAKIFRERGIKTESEIKKYFEVQKDIYKKTGGGGGLMVTRGLEPWLEKNVLSGNRKYVAIIDTTDVPLKDMTRSTRGFGDEIFINNPQNAKVVKVISIEEALKLQEANKFTKSQLTDIWNEANKAIDTTDPRNFGSAEEFVKAIKSEADNYGIKLNVLNRKPLKKEMLAGKYRNNEITIFTKDYNGNPKSVKALEDTFNHEVGHFFDHKRRGIVANPMGDSIRGYDGKLRPMMDSDIYFRNGPKVNEAQKIRELYPRKDGYSSTQKEIYADAFKLYKKDKTKLKEIAPNIYKEISDFAEADEMFKTKSQLTDIWNKENKKKFFNSRKLAKEQLNKLTPEFKTAEQAKFFKEKYIKIIDELAESAKLPEKERFKAYFPSIDIERLKPTTAGRAVSITDESYKKLYKGLIEKELDKPIEALSRTSMKILRDNTAREVLNDAVNTYGKKLIDFKTEADAAKAGYKLIKDKTFGKAIGYLPEREFKYIDNYLFPELGVIDKMAKSLGYDAFSRLFKTAVTSYFPAFHIRNGISGGIQNYQVFGARALHPDNLPIIGRNGLAIMKGSDKEIKLGNRIFNTAELRKELQENFGKTSRYIADLGEYIDELTDGSMKVISKINPKKLGDFIEMNQKANAMAIGLSQGKTIKEAIKLA